MPGAGVAGRLAGRGAFGRVAEGARVVAVVTLCAYCTRVGCYWPTVGGTPEGPGLCAVSSLLRHVSVKTSETLARAGPRGRLVVLEVGVGRLNAAWRGVGVHDADINPASATHAGEKPQHSNDPRWAC